MTDHCSGHPVHLSSFPTPAAGHKSAAVSVEGLPLPCPCECVRYHDADSTVLVWSLRLSPSAPSQQAELKAAATYSILLCGGQSSENSSHVTKQGATEQDDATELLRRIALPLQGQTKTHTHKHTQNMHTQDRHMEINMAATSGICRHSNLDTKQGGHLSAGTFSREVGHG